MLKLRAIFAIVIMVGVIGYGNSAFAQGECGITITKVAPGGEFTEFPFEFDFGDGPESGALSGGQSFGTLFGPSITVTELPLEGWEIADIKCEGEGDIIFNIGVDSVTAECNGIGDGGCTFFNVRSVTTTNIPTLSEWGMIAMAGVLGIIGFIVIRRRKATA